MSIKLMSAIFETEFRDLPTGEVDENNKEKNAKASSLKVTLLALADHANDDGDCWPGYTRLEKKTGLSRQGIADVIKALKFNGLIFVAEEKSKSGTNYYTINTRSFPHYYDQSDDRLLVKPLDYPSQATLLEVVKPLDSNHHITTKESSLGEEEKNSILANSGIEWQILAGAEVSEENLAREKMEAETISAFESAFSIKGNWNWYPAKPSEERVWKKFRENLVQLYAVDKDCFTKYVTWTYQPYVKGSMTGRQIKNAPQDFPDAWASFCMSTKYSAPRRVVPDSERTDLDDNGIPMSYM